MAYLMSALDIARGGIKSPIRTPLLASFGLMDWTPVADEFISDFAQRARSLLIEQFKDSTNLNRLVEVYVATLQETERVLSDLVKCRDLATISGDLLDIAGEIVGVTRSGMIDDEYRALISLQSFLNRSNGEPETLIMAAKLILDATTVHYIEQYPAKVLMQIISPVKPSDALKAMVQRIALGGVQVMFSWSSDSDPDFAFAAEGGLPEEPNTAGLAELPIIVGGGKLVENI
jgi:hypothetical protein